MSQFVFSIDDVKGRMEGTLKSLMGEFAGLRTGRASASLLDGIMVESYGAMVPLSQVGAVSVPEPRLLSVQVWEKTSVAPVEKAIRNAGLGLNPQPDGLTIRIPIPELSQERRKEMAKIASKYAEAARVAVRNVRRDVLEQLKKAQTAKQIGEDEQKRHSDVVQKTTDEYVNKIDAALKNKETDILKV